MEYLLHILILISCYGIASLALNLMSGFTGMISVGNGAFMGIGAYVTAILITTLKINFFWTALLGMLIAMIIALALGIIFSRLNGDYFVLGTLGFALLFFSLARNLDSLTRGPLGIPGISKPSLFGFTFDTNILFVILASGIFTLSFLVFKYLADSSFGRSLKAIREDEKALQVFGYQTAHHKLITFVIAGGFSALGGSLLASYLTFIDPGSFNLPLSVLILTMVVIGGLGSFRGTVVGVLAIVAIPELLRFVGFSPDIAAQMRELIYGLLLVLFMLYRPKGIWGEYKL